MAAILPDKDRQSAVFVNCPFDPEYRPVLDGIVFALRFCGLTVRSALEVRDSGELRLAKILRLIANSRFSIHDISRVELDARSGLPRFNMPLELGIALGAKHLGRAALRDHQLLVLEAERYRYQAFASDLAGVDIAAHGGQVERAVAEIRDFIGSHVSGHLPGADAILEVYCAFEAKLSTIAAAERQIAGELTFTDRMRHLDTFIGSLA